jgi:MFS family permease
MSRLLCLIFFASGASALVFETLWFHQAGLALGNGVWASSLVLSGFMAGLALGNALAARWGDRLGDPVRAYAAAEAAIALLGVGLVLLLPALGLLLAPFARPLLDLPWILNPLRLTLAFVLLLGPSTAMGLTLPLLSKALTESDPNFGRVLGRLYGWNTLGALVGVVATEAYLIAAGALNLAAALIAAGLARGRARTVVAQAPASAAFWRGARGPLAAAFLAGFALLALEVVWFRFLSLFVFNHAVSRGWRAILQPTASPHPWPGRPARSASSAIGPSHSSSPPSWRGLSRERCASSPSALRSSSRSASPREPCSPCWAPVCARSSARRPPPPGP